jgi:hypothetical protein
VPVEQCRHEHPADGDDTRPADADSRTRTSSGTQGSGSGNGTFGRRAAGFADAADGMIVRKDGQSPSRHEKSLLHEA